MRAPSAVLKPILILCAFHMISTIPPASGDDTRNGGPPYYRVWQGFKHPDFSQAQFLATLPGFMNATTNLYMERERIGRNYVVLVPPGNKPDFVPDELALVSLVSENEYRRVRATPEGAAYGESHWAVFDRTKSRSAAYRTGIAALPEILVNNEAYDVIGDDVDWESGYTTCFIGLRKSGVTADNFLARLSRHLAQVTDAFRPMGLKGYVAIANENYEVAYMSWVSQENATRAFASERGQAAVRDASEMMDALYWDTLTPFDRTQVEPGKCYSTRR